MAFCFIHTLKTVLLGIVLVSHEYLLCKLQWMLLPDPFRKGTVYPEFYSSVSDLWHILGYL
jgi:hypothetical protein